MTYFGQHPAVTRGLFALLLVVFLPLIAITFYNYASSPTDENTFADPPSYLRLTAPVPVAAADAAANGMLETGDLLCAVDGIPVKDSSGLAGVAEKTNGAGTVRVQVFRPSLLAKFSCTVDREALLAAVVRRQEIYIQVTDVQSQGASDRAGMKVGDLIFRINGETFANAITADVILRKAWIGRTLSYEIIRGDAPLTLNVTLAKFGIPLPLLLFSLSGLASVIFGGFLGLKRPKIAAARILALAFITVGFAISVTAIQRDPAATLFVRLRGAAILFSIVVGFVAFYQSGLYFPRERTELLGLKWVRWGNVVIAAAVCALFTVLAILGQLNANPNVQTYLLTSGALILVYNAIVRIRFARARSAEYRILSRVKVTVDILGLLVAAGSVVAAILLASPLPFVAGGLALLLVPLGYLYTIGRYGLLDLNVRLRRNVQYSILSVVWGILVGVVFLSLFIAVSGVDLHLPNIAIHGLSIEVLQEPLSPEMRMVAERVILMLLAIVLWYIFWRMRRMVQAMIDRKYFRTRYDYRRAASRLAEVMATRLSMVDLGRGIVEELASLMHLKRAAVFFFRDESVCCCQEASGISPESWQAFCAATGSAFPAAVRQFSGEFRVDYLPAGLKGQFEAAKFRYVVPIRSKDRLIGAIVLGEKLSEATFSAEDLEFLTSVSKQASVAIENAFLYEELAEQERMRHELEIARKIQLASLPQKTPVVEGLDIAGISVPANEVGGDFFDYLNGAAEKLTIVVGDVSGKGTSAALYMSKVQGILRSLHGFARTPGELFTRANQLLCDDLEKNSFVTAVGATFDTTKRSFVLARAGHLPLYCLRSGVRSAQKVTPRGLGLGLNNAGLFVSELEERSLAYGPGDILLFVTDGVTEAQNTAGEEYGEARLLQLLQEAADCTASEVRDRIMRAVRSFAGDAAQHDDQTIVVIKSF